MRVPFIKGSLNWKLSLSDPFRLSFCRDLVRVPFIKGSLHWKL